MLPAIHNLSPALYTQLMSQNTPMNDSGWEVVDDNALMTNWSIEWTMKGDDIIDEANKAEAGEKKKIKPKKQKFDNAGLFSHIISPSLNKTNISGSQGWLSYQKPFVTIVNNRPVGTEDLNKYIGLPIEAKKLLSTLSGYTEVSEIFFPQSGTTALSQDEIEEIKTLLNRGVIL